MKRIALFSTACSLAAVALLYGQATPTPPTPPTPPSPEQVVAGRVARLTTLLSLSTGQQASATSIFTAEENALSRNRQNIVAAHTALDTAVQANDTAGIASAANQIGTLTAQDVQARATADAAFQAILTTDQKTKLQQLGPAGGPRGHGRPRGLGGPGAAPPPPPPPPPPSDVQ
jgi:Spy/CpxP family protein refolding chaperone